MSFSKINPKLVSVILLVAIFILALCIRTILPSERIFSDVGIKYSSADAYYNMRQVDNLAYNYPRHTEIDPYFSYPGASGPVSPRFFSWMVATISWIIGLGAPTQHIIDLVGIYTPTIFGALMVIPVFFIGKELFGRWTGILSAGLLAILPGEFLGRSILGFSDYHILETFFTTTAIMFLILAIKRASQRQITLEHVKKRDWPVIKRPLIYSLVGGFVFGLYIFTWAGALLFVFIFFLYFIIQFFIDHMRKKSTEYLCFVSTPFFLIALIVSLLVTSGAIYYASLFVALIAPVGMCVVSWFYVRKEIKPVYYPLTVLGLGLVGLGLFYLVSPLLVRTMISSFANFVPQGAHITTIETQPLISADYNMQYGSPFILVWGNYPGMIPIKPDPSTISFQNIMSFVTTNFFYAVVSICLLVFVVIKRGDNTKTLLIIWSLLICAINLIQRRFGYYFAVNVALLVGYLAISTIELLSYQLWRLLGLGGSRLSIGRNEEEAVVEGEKKTGKPDKSDSFRDMRRAVVFVVVIIVLVIVYPWNIKGIETTAIPVKYAPSDDWFTSLEWLKENTPEPFGNSDSYYEIFNLPEEGESFEYPESAYGVLSWWDYGYWITRIGHRLPVANPSQDPDALTNVGLFYTSQDVESANAVVEEWDVKYVIIDDDTAFNKFHAVAKWAGYEPVITWAGIEVKEFYEFYIWQENGKWTYGPRFYPMFYKTILTRLYAFDGEAITTQGVPVISFREITDEQEGVTFKEITSETVFETYEEAEAFVASQESPNFRIAGKIPTISPIQQDELEQFKLVHGSGETVISANQSGMPRVKIFEYLE
ncbi:oligosaccharyl transferase, archaeosortase A system-associated [Chloroflexota bacterium]